MIKYFKNRTGQSTTEYLLIIGIVVAMFLAFMSKNGKIRQSIDKAVGGVTKNISNATEDLGDSSEVPR